MVRAEDDGVVGRGGGQMDRHRHARLRRHQASGLSPGLEPAPKGMDALGGDDPFIMEADGKCQLFVPSGLKDGPLPTHYEPVESPVANAVYDQQFNPAAKLWPRPGNDLHAPQDPRYPVCVHHVSPDRTALRRAS